MQYHDLKSPPVVEAIIDIRVSPVVVISKENIQKIVEELGSEYQSFMPLPMRNISLTLKSTTLERLETVRGYIVQTIDGLNKGQFRVDGFTFNRLSPYTSWEEVKQNAQRLWEAYKKAGKPKQISRIAVRYINQMQLDTDMEGINQYLAMPPNMCEKFKASTKSFFTQATIEDIDEQLAATIIQTINQNDNIGKTDVVLDIDAYSLRKFSISNSEQIWECFEKLRNLKNDIFYESITENAIKHFNQ